MTGAETRHQTDRHRPSGRWLTEAVTVSLPRYAMLLAAGAAVVLLLAALD